ncbi:MAG: hypothetical protein GX318_04070, partial [Clostridia bacterium]|nr:hypothetical protein [Clostridia bacterium]
RALKKSGKVIYLTATPSQELYLRWKKKQLPCIQIPARYHGYPLPVPKIIVDKKMNRPRKEVLLSEETMEIIHESIEGDLSQLLVFVPTVILAIQVAEELRSAVRLPPFNNFDASWVQYSYSRDEDRETKREAFLRGDFPILVTTTLWERGITVEKVNVLVLFAHLENIFDERCLIQMAGRSGRNAAYPVGKVWFVGGRVTEGMKWARSRIRELNHEAKRRGYLLPVSTLWLDGWEGRINAERTDKGNKWAGSSTPFKLPFMPRQKGREK